MTFPYNLLAGAGLLLAVFGFGYVKGLNHAAEKALEQALETEITNGRVVTKYVERVVKIPGPAVIRERLVAGVCDGAAGVPGAGHPDAALGADSGVGPADVARDIGACQRNRAQLDALHEVLRPQL